MPKAVDPSTTGNSCFFLCLVGDFLSGFDRHMIVLVATEKQPLARLILAPVLSEQIEGGLR